MLNKKISITNFFTKTLTFLVIIYPLLSVYGIPPINLGMVCMFLLLSIIILTKHKISMKWPKYFWMFFSYMLLSRIFTVTELSFSSIFSLNLISFAILLGFSCKYFDLLYGIRIYRIAVLYCSIFFFIQELMYLNFGSRLVGLLPFLPLNTGFTTSEYIAMFRYNPRSASFFLEPAHFAQYIIPLLALELFNTKKNKSTNYYTILITVVILFLRSGTGILVVALIWIIWGYYYMRNSILYKKLLLIFLIIPVLAIGTYYYLNSKFGNELIERETEFTEFTPTTSAYIRIIRGFELFSDFPTLDRYFGLNSPTKIKLFISRGKMSLIFPEDDLFFSCIQSILIYGGIIGMLLFLIHFNYLFRFNTIEGRMVAISFIGLSIIAPIYLMGEMLLSYTIIHSYQQQSLMNKELLL